MMNTELKEAALSVTSELVQKQNEMDMVFFGGREGANIYIPNETFVIKI